MPRILFDDSKNIVSTLYESTIVIEKKEGEDQKVQKIIFIDPVRIF